MRGKIAVIVFAAILAGASILYSPPGETSDVKAAAGRPNIIFILTDDLDAKSVNRLAKLKDLMVRQGTTFPNTFVTTSICCPSRASILRGQYPHNHGILSNSPKNSGGFQTVRKKGLEKSTVAVWLRRSGYKTAYLGKYFNHYGEGRSRKYVPPGWSRWYALVGNEMNANGKIVTYDRFPTDELAYRSVKFIRSMKKSGSPFFMQIAPRSPHEPASYAPRHRNAFSKARLPRQPSFNEANVSDKPAWIRDNPRLTRKQIREMSRLYRNRLRSMKSVEDMIGRILRALRETGELKNTYVFFTSDNGFHMGQHRLYSGKWTAYEEDMRVPLIVRGPGVPKGKTLPHLVLNNDFAPTFAAMGRASAPGFVDGRSIRGLLKPDPVPLTQWRTAVLQEGIRSPKGRPAYKAIRTRRYTYVEYASGERELYDLREDPFQLDNIYDSADPALIADLKDRLAALRDCSGDACRKAEDGRQPGGGQGRSAPSVPPA